MFEIVLSDPAAIDRYRNLPFALDIEKYLGWLRERGYSQRTIVGRFFHLAAFARYLRARRVKDPSKFAEYIPQFVRNRIKKLKRTRHIRCPRRLSRELGNSIQHFLSYLGQVGVLTTRTGSYPEFQPLFQDDLEKYVQFLRAERGLATATINFYRFIARKFLSYIQEIGINEWAGVSLEVVCNFLSDQGKTTGRRGMRTVGFALRSLFQFLQMEGRKLAQHLLAFPQPKVYQQEDLPVFLSPKQIANILNAVDRKTSGGIRDYAVLLLLITYGMRAAEVARLTLDDLDWSAQRIHLKCRKSGRNDAFPLSATVGEAILEYLQRVRPRTSCRQVFLALHAPLRSFLSGAPISIIAHKYLTAAGINFPRRGAHALRHTCAHHLLEEGFSYKTIGDYLGHSSASSTGVYLKVDLNNLLQVAQNDGEDLL